MQNEVDTGVRAPALRTLPKLSDGSGRTLNTDRSQDGVNRPRMLGVNFSQAEGARVYVGTNLFTRDSLDYPLDIDPGTAKQGSLVLDLREPRAHMDENVSVRYEGSIVAERPVARFRNDLAARSAWVTDSGVSFCAFGIEDERVAGERAIELGVSTADVAAFQKQHADFVVITSDLLPREDAYWEGARCGGAQQAGASYLQCRAQLGTRDVPLDRRELRVVAAGANDLQVEPRHARSLAEIDEVNALLACCFPGTVSYTVRASKEWVVQSSGAPFRHKIVADASGACVRDTCDPLRTHFESRAFEVSCRGADDCPKDEAGVPVVGAAAPGEVGCVLSGAAGAPLIASLPTSGTTPTVLQRCIFQNLTSRFVVYRGQQPSQRDMEFAWQVRGGFAPWLPTLAVTDTNAVPEAMLYVPAMDSLVVTDGSAQGLLVLPMTSLSPRAYY